MEPQKSSGLAVASMILGIIGFVLGCCVFVSIPCAVLGLILGIGAMISIANGTGSGKGMAVSGIIMSLLTLVFVVLTIAAPALFPAFITDWEDYLEVCYTLPTYL